MTYRKTDSVGGTVYDYWVSELARIPAYIQDSPYRDYLTRQIADEDQRRHAHQVHEQEVEAERVVAFQEDEAWGAWLEATHDPDNERLEDRSDYDGYGPSPTFSDMTHPY